MHHFAVHGERLHRPVRGLQDGPAGGLVHPARLHADEAVLDHVHPADAVRTADRVEVRQERCRAHPRAVHRHRHSPLELDLEVGRAAGGRLGRDGEDVHLLRRLGPRILQDAPLEADMKEIPIAGIGPLRRHGRGDAVLLCILHEVGARAEGPLPPRGDDPDGGIDGIVGQLESDLVIPLAGGPVGDGVRPLSLRHSHLGLGDERSRHGGPQEVAPLVQGVGLQTREHEVSDELLAEVLHVTGGRTRPERLLTNRLNLFPLAHVRHKGHHLALVGLDQPPHDDRGVQPPRVRQHDLLDRPGRDQLVLAFRVRRCTFNV